MTGRPPSPGLPARAGTRWGVIGTGAVSARLVPDLQATSGGRVRGVWGRSRDRVTAFAAEHSIPFATTERDELLARDDVDAVYVATPAQTHKDLALEALDAGKHVLVEKPMAMSGDEVDEVFARAEAVQRFVMEAMWMRFNPLHLDIFRRIDGGVLGEVRNVRASFGMPFRPTGGRPAPAHGGSAWLDRGIYTVTLAQWALGQPTAVRAEGRSQDGVDVSGHATLEFPDGAFAQLACSNVEFLDLSAAISGTHGWIGIDPMFWAGGTADIRAGSLERVFHRPERLEHSREGSGFRPMLRAVEQALAEGRLQHPHHDHDSTAAVIRTLDVIRDQIRHGEGDATS